MFENLKDAYKACADTDLNLFNSLENKIIMAINQAISSGEYSIEIPLNKLGFFYSKITNSLTEKGYKIRKIPASPYIQLEISWAKLAPDKQEKL